MHPASDQSTAIDPISVGIVTICLLPAFMWDSIQFSHRFVGPILRLHSYIRKSEESEHRDITLRTHDFWKDLIGDFNKLMSRIEATKREGLTDTVVLPDRTVNKWTNAGSGNARPVELATGSDLPE